MLTRLLFRLMILGAIAFMVWYLIADVMARHHGTQLCIPDPKLSSLLQYRYCSAP